MGIVRAVVAALSLQLVSAHVRPRQEYGGSNTFYNSTVVGPPITAPPTGVPSIRPLPTGSLSPSNASHKGLAHHGPATCCFIIYDTLSADFWAHYSTTTWLGLRRVTSTLTAVTEYVDTTITKYHSTTTYKTETYITSWQIGVDNVKISGFSDGPYMATTMLNGTKTSTDGQVIASPTGFWVFPTVRVLHVPAVTQANGQLACATTSEYDLLCTLGGGVSVNTNAPAPTSVTLAETTALLAKGTFTGLNSYVQDYYSGQQGHTLQTEGTYATITSTVPTTNSTAYPSTTVLSFSTPYIYFPPEGKNESLNLDGVPTILPASVPPGVSLITPNVTSTSYITLHLTSTEYVTVHVSSSVPVPTTTRSLQSVNTDPNDYGWLPTAVIDFIKNNPEYATQIPDIDKCIPGGPDPIPNNGCASAAAAVAEAVPDLTTGDATTVTGVGCFHPGACGQARSGNAAQGAQANSPTDAASPGSSVAVGPVAETQGPVAETQATPVAETQAPPVASDAGDNPFSAIAPIPVIPTSKVSPPSSKQPEKPQPKVVQAPQPSGQAENNPPPAPASPSEQIPKIVTVPKPSNQAENSGNAAGPAKEPSPFSNPAANLVVPNAGETTAPANQEGSSPQSNPQAAKPSSSGLGAIIAGAFTGHPVITEGSQVITADSASNFVVGSQTIAPGAPEVTISGSTFSLAPAASAIVVNGQTSALYVMPSPAASGPILTINSSPVAPDSASAYIVGDQTLAPGSSAITVSGTTYSLPSSASSIIVNGTPSPLPPASANTPAQAPVLTIGSQPITANPSSAYTISGQTLAPGSAPITVGGTTYSLAPSASAIVVNGATSSLSSPTLQNSAAPAVITIASTPYTASPTPISELVLGNQTLIPGAPAITIANTPVSLASGGSAVVLDGTTETLEGTAPVITVGSSTIKGSQVVGTGYVVGSQTLIPGAEGVTIGGESVSLEATPTAVVVGGSTEAFSAPVGTGVGYTGVGFTAGASRRGVGLWGGVVGVGVLGFWGS